MGGEGARHGNADAVKALIAAGADVNATANDGFTGLHWAARHGDVNVVKVLVASGADIGATDSEGRTPLDLAKQGKHRAAVDALEAAAQ